MTGLRWSHVLSLSLAFPYSVATLLISLAHSFPPTLSVSHAHDCLAGVVDFFSFFKLFLEGCEEGKDWVDCSRVGQHAYCSLFSRLTFPPLLHNLPFFYFLPSRARGLCPLLLRHVFPGRLRVRQNDSSVIVSSLCFWSCVSKAKVGFGLCGNDVASFTLWCFCLKPGSAFRPHNLFAPWNRIVRLQEKPLFHQARHAAEYVELEEKLGKKSPPGVADFLSFPFFHPSACDSLEPAVAEKSDWLPSSSLSLVQSFPGK